MATVDNNKNQHNSPAAAAAAAMKQFVYICQTLSKQQHLTL